MRGVFCGVLLGVVACDGDSDDEGDVVGVGDGDLLIAGEYLDEFGVEHVITEAEWWVDPIVGLLVRSPDGRRAQFRLYTEIGGFGAGSEIAWQVFPNAGIRLTERLGFEFGYRALGTDYESGEEGDHFVWDTVMHGPAVGLTIRF